MAAQVHTRRPIGERGNGARSWPRLFTINEYDHMLAAGILCEDERVELLDGEIIEMSPINPPHAACLRRLIYWFSQSIGDRGIIDAQDPVRLLADSKPQPDLAILRPRADFYAGRHPEPEDILLVIEISDTTFALDRVRKIPGYAAAGIPEAWQFDLKGDRVLVYRNPQNGRYTEVITVGRDDTLTPLAFPDLVLRVDDVLP